MNWTDIGIGFGGFILFVLVVAVIVAAIQSVRGKDACHVELDVPEYYGYTGKIIAHVSTFEEADAVVRRWRAMIDRNERPEEPEPYDAARHAGRLP